MKIAVLSDIHANYVAFQEIVADIEAWQPDEVIIAGDIVNRGPRSPECLALALQKQRDNGWHIVRGNHEEYIMAHAAPDAARSGTQFEIYRNGYWTYTQLGDAWKVFEAWPFSHTLDLPNGQQLRVVHASMRGNRKGTFPWQSNEKVSELLTPLAPVMCVAHTHRPFIRNIENALLINVGSVGLPFDGNHAASYGRLTVSNGTVQAEIQRVSFDRQAAKQDFYDSGFLAEAGPLAQLILHELKVSASLLGQFEYRYAKHVLDGTLTLDQAVSRYLEEWA